MRTERLDRDQFRATLDLSHVSQSHAADDTLLPTVAPAFRTSRRPADADINDSIAPPPITLEGSGNTIRVKDVIAEGGMGVVRLAEQGALRREVAVKTLRDECLTEDFVQRMLREARVTGLVEHPNIVPIYALQKDDRDSPMMVMKRIEGVSWRALMRDPKHESGLVDEDDALAWHLGVLMKVCDAIHYAHDRGILHLDLKPDNVMIGRFRDVYVVDWGVACAIDRRHAGFLPVARDVREVLGTPAYLAPEMVDVAHTPLGLYTDVYLLGAVLHEILSGRPPHRGNTLEDILYAAYEATPPEFDDDVPVELAAIARKAMDPAPSKRFEDVEAFRRAIDGYLRHRSSVALAEESSRKLERIREALRSAPIGEKEESGSDGRLIQRLFSECRFGFATALDQWPGNPAARAGLAEATLLMAGFHIDREDAASAEALLDELHDPPAALSPRIDACREAIAILRADSERQRQFSREQDDISTRRARAIYVLVAAASLGTPVLVSYLFQVAGLYRYEWWHSVAYTLILTLFLGTGALAMKRDLMPNRASRRVILTLCVLAMLILARRLVGIRLGEAELADMSNDVFFFGAGNAIMATLGDRRFFAPAVAFCTAAVSIAFWPTHTLLFVALSAFLGPGSMAGLWLHADRARRKKEHARRKRERARRDSLTGSRGD